MPLCCLRNGHRLKSQMGTYMLDLEAPSLSLGNTLVARSFYGFLTALSLRASRSPSLFCRPRRTGIAAAIYGFLGILAVVCPAALAQSTVTLQYNYAVSTIYTGQQLGSPTGVAAMQTAMFFVVNYPSTAEVVQGNAIGERVHRKHHR